MESTKEKEENSPAGLMKSAMVFRKL